jgi:hypothetical protein
MVATLATSRANRPNEKLVIQAFHEGIRQISIGMNLAPADLFTEQASVS